MLTHNAHQNKLLEQLQSALSLHLQAVCVGSSGDMRGALLAYKAAAHLVGLHDLPTQTSDVLNGITCATDERVVPELRALYIDIQRVATDNANLEWHDQQLALILELRSALRKAKLKNGLAYLVSPRSWHKRQRRLLLNRTELILPLILFSTSVESERALRSALKTDCSTPICLAFYQLLHGNLSPRTHYQRANMPSSSILELTS